MPGFQFELSQLVNVPGKDGLQGRIASRMEYVNGRSTYGVMWLTDSLEAVSAPFVEGDLIEAQKPKPATTLTVNVEADTSDVDAKIERTTASAKRLQETADAALDSLSKLPRNVLNLPKRSASKRRARR